jgi:hypothetical protein
MQIYSAPEESDFSRNRAWSATNEAQQGKTPRLRQSWCSTFAGSKMSKKLEKVANDP